MGGVGTVGVMLCVATIGSVVPCKMVNAYIVCYV